MEYFAIPEKRKAYDALLKQHKIISHSAGLPIQSDVSFDQFHDESESVHDVDLQSHNQECHCYWFPCRCGGSHVLDDLAVLSQVPCLQTGMMNFDVPSAPPPFKGLEKDKVETRKRQALFLRQALRIVERFAHNPVNTDMLAYALPWLEREQYDDISIERNAYGNCGYALCSKPKGQTIKQKYRICTTTRRVYDITKRQISKEPAWCRSADSLKPRHISLLPPNVPGHVGKVILDVQNRLLLNGSESDSSIENELNVNTESESIDLSSSTLEYSRKELEKLALGTNNENGIVVRDICPHALDSVESRVTSYDDQSEMYLKSPSDCEQLLDNQNVPTNLCDKLSKRLQEWLTEKAFVILTTYTFTSEEPTSVDGLHSKILQQFFSKHISSKGETREKTQFSDYPLTCVLPLIDSVSPEVLRRQILLDDLKKSMHPILDALQINIHCVYRRLENSVLYFNLTSKNVHMNPNESQLMALVILFLMANVEPALAQLTNDKCITRFLNSINGPSLLLFKNKIINQAMTMYRYDSDD
ncbi:RNA polymerase II subunit B1 CTD phosphatase RPAP2 [Schistosoma bovis]|uniref:RNA polymerase II subunit B1 CTD phosphatase RPAP2 homolog n=1 Tax=Schistosoma bovis TaxID=6184 RepID=A0A430QMG9_SCHBO|nr:RNA polymerase II subunit B1 CTD phosphatase RPAP2 [Schistosoma bovis]